MATINSIDEKKLNTSSDPIFMDYFNKIDEYIIYIDTIMGKYSNETNKKDYIKLKDDIFNEKNYINEIFNVLKTKETEFNELSLKDKQFIMTDDEDKMLYGELNTYNQRQDLNDLGLLNR